MNKTDFACELAALNGITKAEAIKTTNAMIEILESAIRRREPVKLTGFGKFEIKDTPERMARNPQTMEEVLIPKRHRVVFRPSKTLLSDLNGEDK